MQIEQTILKNLLQNDEYSRKVLPFIKTEYFSSDENKILFQEIKDFIIKYNTIPSLDAIKIEIENLRNLDENQYKGLVSTIDTITSDSTPTSFDWLVDNTEIFCQEKAIYSAMMSSIEIMNNKNSPLAKGTIPKLLSDALAVSFDPNVGHDYLENVDGRYDYYHRIQERIPFELEYFNKITKGGVPKKTLNVILAGCVHPDTKIRVRIRKKG